MKPRKVRVALPDCFVERWHLAQEYGLLYEGQTSHEEALSQASGYARFARMYLAGMDQLGMYPPCPCRACEGR